MLKNRQIDEALLKAKSHFDSKEFSAALNILSNIIEEEPEHTQSLFMMANIFHIKGEISKAIKAFKRVLDVDPGHTDAAISLSVLLNDIGQYEEARKIFTTASDRVKLNNEDDSLNDNHINKKFSLKHYEMAELFRLIPALSIILAVALLFYGLIINELSFFIYYLILLFFSLFLISFIAVIKFKRFSLNYFFFLVSWFFGYGFGMLKGVIK